MGKAVVKLYRDPGQAKKALEELLSQGYKWQEISLLTSTRADFNLTDLVGGKVAEVPLAEGTLVAVGPVGQRMSHDSSPQALRETLDIPEEGLAYYQFGLTMGGVLVGVHAEGERLAQARRILRAAERVQIEKAQSPGFDRAVRMTSSDHIDAKMTGDFRRY